MAGSDNQNPERRTPKEMHSSTRTVRGEELRWTLPPDSGNRLSENGTDVEARSDPAPLVQIESAPESTEDAFWSRGQMRRRLLGSEELTEPAPPPDEFENEGRQRKPTLQPKGTRELNRRHGEPEPVAIPRAPRLPKFEFETASQPSSASRAAHRSGLLPRAVSEALESRYPETLRTPPPSNPESEAPPASSAPSQRPRVKAADRESLVPSSSELDSPETLRTPPSGMRNASDPSATADFSTTRSSSHGPQSLYGVERESRPRETLPSGSEAIGAGREENSGIYFAPHLRIQAGKWLETGSFVLPGVSSERHSRALQRALLLVILHEPGWSALPDGLQQRAVLLFSDGWEASLAAAHPFREIDDLATVLGMACNGTTRSEISHSVRAWLPISSRGRSSSRPPPTLR